MLTLRSILISLLLLVILVHPTLAAAQAPSAADVGPTVVKVERLPNGSFVYLVGGEPQFMVGMGYNAIYRFLTDEERAARYDVDFSRMRELGVNTILGWDADKGYEQDKFDRLTLDKAWEHGLGVVMPFYLPPDGDYVDPWFRAWMMDELLAKVEAYKDHPALRMWGIGNEVIEPLAAREDEAQVEAFNQFYRELAEVAREADPNHPVIYREAEDYPLYNITWYDPEEAIAEPWLLYGINAYTLRLEEILGEWPEWGLNLPLFITEFAPEGWPSDIRPDGYVIMWRMIRSHPDFVLGGAPYVWTTDGPEPVDAHFGLVDADGNPTDGSLDALASEFQEVAPPDYGLPVALADGEADGMAMR
ncbi:MAG: hypothetical protein HYY30_08715 [Chloroflexi bacterium]|nr:hypothetical protein [Chloroflexota bacterium]